MGLIKRVSNWSQDGMFDYLSVNPTREEVAHYRVDPEDESDNSISKLNVVKDFDNITCIDYSETDIGLVGVGEKNGMVRILNMIYDFSGHGTTQLQVRAKQQRAVNALGMSASGLIAMGMERNRHDSSLQVWDVNYQSTDSNVVNPSFSYCLNETVVSLKFLDDTTLITGTNKLLKEIDLRSPHPAYQHPTRISYDIKINPFKSWQFTTYGDDGTLAIWDRRKLGLSPSSNDSLETQPLLKFDKLMGAGAASRKYTNSCFRWSAVRGDEFTTLHGGQLIRRWRLGSYPTTLGEDNSNGSSRPPTEIDSLFVSTVHDINTTYDRVTTFDYIPRDDGSTNFICMRQSGTIYRMSLKGGASIANFNCDNNLIMANNDRPNVTELQIASMNEKISTVRKKTASKNLSFEDLDLSDEDVEASEREIEDETTDLETSDGNFKKGEGPEVLRKRTSSDEAFVVLLKPEILLQNDISMIIKRRALLNYGLDPLKTVELIDSSKSLQNNAYIRNTWRWLSIAKASDDDGTMVSGELDLGYEGILGIWNGLDGLSKQNRYREGTILTEKQLSRELEKIIRTRGKYKSKMGESKGLLTFTNSSKPVQRKLCMIISGWDLNPSDYEEKYKNLIKADHYEKAAGWAVFFGDVTKAIEILSSAKKERLRLIATAIAGYLAYKDQPGNNAWRQQCRRMSSDLDDPYLRVIFGFIADDDWWDILSESAISLRERLGVALRFLNDKDLTRFLESTAESVIANGELEGLILTGITPRGINLLQSYVNKTSDVQTAALLSIFGCPRYFESTQVEEWVQTYRTMLNSWELFSVRAKFDVLRGKLSRTANNPAPSGCRQRQLYIQCLKCNKNINNPVEPAFNARGSSSAPGVMKSFGSGRPARKFGLNNASPSNTAFQKHSCPHCGTPFPRCAICLLPLGTANLPIVIRGASPETKAQENDPHNTQEARRLKLNEWFSFCLTCNHGMHAGHAEEWFEKHLTCPVPGCSCRCNT
ncbi:LANO_0F12596g1_1 [Lachancea nothofagi CBS 11611]|uniref:LANO_0F12596g1_1 n=1 Tax=Lachancea nothofagi CBS 11611 TaxID=1266666 RepID=A0A1G4KBG6_9SACH|nr:LANO_0F12596g1_1 [Lachancea nothofagi CBS 11611]